jgi:hypothetical protein
MRALPLLVLLAACSAKLSGSIDVDGKKFDISSCQSGQPLGFTGIQLTDESGRRLRLVANADGTANAIVFVGEAQGDDLGKCGTLEVHNQNSKINDVTNVEGTAKISCSGSHKLEGTLTFENCH